VIALPPAAIDSWNCTSDFVGVPPRARPSFVADFMKRLRRVSGPSLSGLKGETGDVTCSIIGQPLRLARLQVPVVAPSRRDARRKGARRRRQTTPRTRGTPSGRNP